jgi:hypothetical protein
MRICMQTPLLSPLLNLVLSVGKDMLPIEDLMVDGGCIATTGDRNTNLLPPVVAMHAVRAVRCGTKIRAAV